MSYDKKDATRAGTPPPSTEDITKTILIEITKVVHQTVTAIEGLGDKQLATQQRLGIHIHELAEDLAGSTIDWLRRWPT